MAGSPTSIENQIDSFLEQFNRSGSRNIVEEHDRHTYTSNISHSCSANLDLEVYEAGKSFFLFIFFLLYQKSINSNKMKIFFFSLAINN